MNSLLVLNSHTMRVYQHFVVLLLSTFFVVFTAQQVSAQEVYVPLIAGENAPDINSYIIYSKAVEGKLNPNGLPKDQIEFEKVETNTIHFGITDQEVILYFKVRNIGSIQGEWILATGRKSIKNFKLYVVEQDKHELRIDSNDIRALNSNILKFFNISHPFELQPSQERTFAISFVPQKSFHLPLKIQTAETFTQRLMWHNIIVFGAFSGILVLVIVNASFFILTGNKSFTWLGLSQLFFGLQALQTSGHLTYWFYVLNNDHVYNQSFNSLIGAFVKMMYVVFVVLFTKSFIRTKENYPIFNKLLVVIALMGVLLCGIQAFDFLLDRPLNFYVFSSIWILVFVTVLMLPIVAIRATIDINKNYWPLIVAWSGLVLFVFYGVSVTLNFIPSLPAISNLVGPVGLFETFFGTLALALHVNEINRDKILVQGSLTEALALNLKKSEAARKHAEDRVIALSIINEQSSLLHASGHDSKQVITALNAAIHMLENEGRQTNQTQLKDIIESSSNYLKQIVSTTISAAHSTIVDASFIALSRFSANDIFSPLEMLYKKQIRKKGLMFSSVYSDEDYLITDIAILSRAISNFISNSIKFTDIGEIEIRGFKNNGRYEIQISDTGIGLSQDALNQLNTNGESRFRGQGAHIGTGTGFRFSKQLIEGLGGSVKVENAATNGAMIVITLPYFEEYTLCTLHDLQALLPDYYIHDLDLQRDIEKPNKAIRMSSIAVTYDESPITRERLSEKNRYLLYKPLTIEMCLCIKGMQSLDHP